MALAAGTKLGPYEILSALGAGGMGEVYRARDLRLGRDVAIKVLPAHLSADPNLKARFEREAKAISSLSHAHICALYDVGQHEGTEFLVLELLEGETLADRLLKGALPTRQVVEYGIQMADALEAAHKHGIMHRDLKPGNIMLTKAGAKLMDFGLAKPAPIAAAAAVDTPTVSRPLTAEGTIVGTYQYMAPEQVEGKDADARTDIFALGAVLYEMTTGKRAFQGKSQMSVMSAILEREPEPISTLNPMAPPALEHVVRRCLEKSSEQRWQSAQDLKLELEWVRQAGSQAGAPALTGTRKPGRALVAAAVIAIALAMLALGYFLRAPQPAAPTWANLNLSGDLFDEEGNFSLSPDGQKVAYVAATQEGKLLLWVRSLNSPKAQPLEGTEGAEFPFWSPDSQSIGFFTGGKMKRIDASGERLQSICDVLNGRGGTWNREGTIVFAPNLLGGLARVSAAGGTPVEITHSEDAGRSHRWPFFLPDGRHFLFVSYSTSVRGTETGLYAGSLDAKEIKLVGKGIASNAAYLEPGTLLYVREGQLVTQAFDAKKLELSGEPEQLDAAVRYIADREIADFSAVNGALIFLPPSAGGRQLVWFDREGRQLGVAATDVGRPSSGSFGIPLLSPDGTHAAVERTRGNASDIWIYDLRSGAGTRLTFVDGFNSTPIWMPDGSAIAYESSRPVGEGIYLHPLGGAGTERLLVKLLEGAPSSFSPDGRFLVFTNIDKNFINLVLPLAGGQKAFAYPQSQGATALGNFSPDGKWMAYYSDESGRGEVYVVPFPNAGGKFQISNGGSGGFANWWVGHGEDSELLYFDSQSHLVSVPMQTGGGTLKVGTAQVLLGGKSLANTGYVDITRDGKRIMLSQPQPNANSALTLVLGWSAKVKK